MGRRRTSAVAETIARVLNERLRWPSAVFIPDDSFQVVCNGRSFDFNDEFVGEAAIIEIEVMLAITVAPTFWQGKDQATFGEVVDGLLALKQQT